jgi:hypothetical protein
MAKDLESIAGLKTLELPGVTRPGRKPKGERPLTNAERQAAFRAKRIALETGERMANTISELASEFELSRDEVIQHLLRFALCNKNWRQAGFPSRNKE